MEFIIDCCVVGDLFAKSEHNTTKKQQDSTNKQTNKQKQGNMALSLHKKKMYSLGFSKYHSVRSGIHYCDTNRCGGDLIVRLAGHAGNVRGK